VHEPLFEIPSLRAILTEEWEALPKRLIMARSPGILNMALNVKLEVVTLK
jgi:hypothetical protein